jgi:hypothetical protein
MRVSLPKRIVEAVGETSSTIASAVRQFVYANYVVEW